MATENVVLWGWKNGLAIKSTGCSSKEFNSQQSQSGSQKSVVGADALFWCI